MPRVGSSTISTLGPSDEPLGEHDLLLVAAAERGGGDLDRRRLDVQLAADRADAFAFARLRDQPIRRVAVQRGQRDVLADRRGHDEAGRPPIFGDETHPAAYGVRRLTGS